MYYALNSMLIICLILILLVEFFISSHVQFTLWPEMVLYPWLHNNGFHLYRDIINPYFPMLTWILGGVTKIFGYDLKVFIYFTWGYILLTQIIFVAMTQKLFYSKKITIMAFLLYAALLTIFEGNSLWFDLFCTLPLLGAYYYLAKKENRQKYLIAGIFLGLGVLIKQTVIWTIIFLIIYQLILRLLKTLNTKKLIINTLSLISPIALMVIGTGLILYFQGIFKDFVFWSIKLPFGSLQKTSGFVEWPTRRNIFVMLFSFWPVIFFLPKIVKDNRLILALVFFLATFLFAFPRFGYFHLVVAAMFFSIIAGKFLIERSKFSMIYGAIILVLVSMTIKRSMPFSVRFFNKDTYMLAQKIEQQTKGDKFFVQNAPQQIYFINNIIPPRPWAINFPWYFENTGLQTRVIRALKEEKIKWIVFEKYQQNKNKFVPGTYRPEKLQQYLDKEYIISQEINSNILLLHEK